MRARLLTAAGLFALVLVIWAYLRVVGPLPGDLRLFAWVRTQTLSTQELHLLNFFGVIATEVVAIITVAVAVAIVAASVGARAALLVLAAAAAVGFNELLRAALGPTPTSAAVLDTAIENYPSGHIVYATAFFGVLAWLGWHHGRRDATVVLVGLIVAMAPARIYSGAHLLSDVVGGYALGGAWLLVAVTLYSAALRPDGLGPRGRPAPKRRAVDFAP